MTITIRFSKYIFSPIFSKKLHDFSEKHSNEPLKMFKESWTHWTIEHKINIQEEIDKMRTQSYFDSDEVILKNMYTSARFYYRKKIFKQKKQMKQPKQYQETNEKQETYNNNQNQNETQYEKKEPTNKKSKPYIGLSSEFICLIDETIHKKIIQESKQNLIVKINKKQLFSDFTIQYLDEINKEIGILKKKYDIDSILFEPIEISKKIQKTFQNRAYIVCKSI